MLRKLIFFLALGYLLIPFFSAHAADVSSQIPALNPLCWTKDDCVAQRKKFKSDMKPQDAADGWVKEDVCVGDWGKCLPAGQTETEISFGGQTKFKHLGEFILVMYRYAMVVAGILGAIVIIIAGMQWVTSGGNTEAIGKAKKRIAGAVIGLFIAYASYFILSTVNPALVKLRLPQVFLLKPIAMMPEFCSDIEGVKEWKLKLAKVAVYTDQKSAVDITKTPLKYETMPNDSWLYCGARFLTEKGGSATCKGDYCGKGSMCMELGDGWNVCKEGAILAGKIFGGKEGGTISSCLETIGRFLTGLESLQLDFPPISMDGRNAVRAVCKNSAGAIYMGEDVTNEIEPSYFPDSLDRTESFVFVDKKFNEEKMNEMCGGYDSSGKEEKKHGPEGFVVRLSLSTQSCKSGMVGVFGRGGKVLKIVESYSQQVEEDNPIADALKKMKTEDFIPVEELQKGARIKIKF